jgi:hypothetical protein
MRNEQSTLFVIAVSLQMFRLSASLERGVHKRQCEQNLYAQIETSESRRPMTSCPTTRRKESMRTATIALCLLVGTGCEENRPADQIATGQVSASTGLAPDSLAAVTMLLQTSHH